MKNIFRLIITMVLLTSVVCGQNTLDNLGLTASTPSQVAFGLRKLSSSYSGNALKVRRISDQAEATVAFDGSGSVSGTSMVSLTSGVTLGASLGTAEVGTVSSVAGKTGTIGISPTKTGTITVSTSTNPITITGNGTQFLTEILPGDLIYNSTNTLVGVVKTVDSNTSITLNNNAIVGITGGSFKTTNAIVSGSGTLFLSEFAVGDQIFRTSDLLYLGTIKAIINDTQMIVYARDAVNVSGISFCGTSTTLTGSGTSFSGGLIGKMLISNNITLGVVSSVESETALTLTNKAGAAVSSMSFNSIDPSMTFLSFYSGTSVYVNTWYDQSGNGRNAIQLNKNNQPRIVNSGTLNTVGGKPAVEFNSTLSSYLLTSEQSAWLNNTSFTLNIVSAESGPVTTYSLPISTSGGSGPANSILHFGYRSASQYTVAQYANDVNFNVNASTSLELHTTIKSTSSNVNYYHNGISFGSQTSPSPFYLKDLGLLSIGYYSGSNNYFRGSISELTVYSLAMNSTDRANMDNSQLSNYGITSGTWTGSVDQDWFNAGNWSSGVVPSEIGPAMVIVPEGITNQPLIAASTTAQVLNLQVLGSSSLTVEGTLQVYGNLSNISPNRIFASTGNIIFKGNAAQSILSNTFNGNTVKNLTLEASTYVWVSLYGSITVSGVFALKNNNRLNFQTGSILTLGGTTVYESGALIRSNSNASIVATGTPELRFDQSTSTNILRNLTVNSTGTVTLGSKLILNANGVLTFTAGKLAIGSNALVIGGGLVNTVPGGITGSATSEISFEGSTNRTISFDQTIPGTTNLLNNFSVNTTAANTITAANDFLVIGTLTIAAAQSLNMGTNVLGGTLSAVGGTGTISTQNTSVAPIPGGKTWLGTINFNSPSTAQYAVPGIYNNLSINTTGGVTAVGNIEVGGQLNLITPNPSSTKGSLDMGTYTLSMGGSATTTGVGEVSGIVRREHSFTTNTLYTFGSQYTTISFMDEGIRPTWISLKISIGGVPGWDPWSPTGKVARYYNIAVSDNSSTAKAVVDMKYLPDELDGTYNDESKLVFWHKFSSYSGGSPHEHGKSNQNFVNHYIGVSGIVFSSVCTSTLADSEIALAYSLSMKNTWKGEAIGNQTNWEDPLNWSYGHVPTSTEDVLIPSGLTYYPSLTASSNAIARSIEIESGASLTANDSDINISGYQGAWINDGTFNAGTGKVTFSHGIPSEVVTVSGITNFYDIEAGANTTMQPVAGCILRIAGAGIADPTSIVDFSTIENTVEYNGSNQIIVNPSGLNGNSGYFNLTLSGSGTKTMPTSAMNVRGSLAISGTTTVTSLNVLTIGGNLNLGAGTNFTTGSFSHTVGGNFENNGDTFNATGSTFTFNGIFSQSIAGNSNLTFANVIIDNASGLLLNNNGITNIAGDLTINSGKSFELSPLARLSVGGTFINNNGTSGLLIQSDASGTGSLIQNNTGIQASVQRYMTGNKWHQVAGPATQDISAFIAANDAVIPTKEVYLRGLMEFNTHDNVWDTYGSVDFGISSFGSGQGFMLRTTSDVAVNFSGTLNAGTVQVAVDNTGNRWNCIGNPYSSAISLNTLTGGTNFYTTNESLLEDSYKAFYIWDESGTPMYKLINNADPASYAQSGQGFFVRAKTGATGNFQFTQGMQVHQNAVALKSAEISFPEIKLSAVRNGQKVSTSIKFIEGMNPGLDMGYDAGIIKADPDFSIHTRLVSDNGIEFMLQCLDPEVINEVTIPVGLDCTAGGELTLSAETFNLPFDCELSLEDKLNGVVISDFEKRPYSLIVDANSILKQRFYVKLAMSTLLNAGSAKNDISAYVVKNREIRIDGIVSRNSIANLYDIQGKLILNQRLEEGIQNSISLPFISEGIYILKVKDNDSLRSFKLAIRR